MDSGQGVPPAQGQFYDSYQAAYPPPMQGEVQGIPVAQYPPASIGPSQYPPNPPPMQYPPQQPGNYQYPYQPMPSPAPAYNQAQPQVYVVQNDGQFDFSSQTTLCPTCREMVPTRTQRSPSAAAWISFCLLLILFAFFWLLPLCCIPFCIPSCYNVKHYCPRCGTLLGERRA